MFGAGQQCEIPLSAKKSPVLSGTGCVKRSREEVFSDGQTIMLSVPEEEVPDFASGGGFKSHTFLDDLWIYRFVMELDLLKEKVKDLPFFDAISKESDGRTELDFEAIKKSLELVKKQKQPFSKSNAENIFKTAEGCS